MCMSHLKGCRPPLYLSLFFSLDLYLKNIHIDTSCNSSLVSQSWTEELRTFTTFTKYCTCVQFWGTSTFHFMLLYASSPLQFWGSYFVLRYTYLTVIQIRIWHKNSEKLILFKMKPVVPKHLDCDILQKNKVCFSHFRHLWVVSVPPKRRFISFCLNYSTFHKKTTDWSPETENRVM